VLATVLVFFAPGFAWTLVFFRRLDVIERLVLSIALSIALVTLSILVLNVLFGVGINGLSALITIIIITAVPLTWYGLRRFLGGKDA
jgi:uncharacterized membrane protein